MAKRLLDIGLGIALALLMTPLVVVLAIGSAIALRSWPFFVQTRVGRDGRLFRIVKIRTLPRTAPAYADKYRIASTVRVPRFTMALRNLHLDELPQLYLVVSGQMSLVGPRPEMQQLHETFDAGFAAARTSVRPGCSGLWQVSTGASNLIGEVPEYDLVYVANATARLDLWILWRTLGIVTNLAAPKRLDEIPRWALRRREAEPEPAVVIDLRDAALRVVDGDEGVPATVQA